MLCAGTFFNVIPLKSLSYKSQGFLRRMSFSAPTSSRPVLFARTDAYPKNGEDELACETPVALVYNGISHTVMMCTPQELEDFALGFSLAEKIINHPSEFYGVDIIQGCNGIELHIEIATRQAQALAQKRRTMAGRTGCGICGTEQLEQVVRPSIPLLQTQLFELSMLDNILRGVLRERQIIGSSTGASHAALWLNPDGQIMGIREDIGRHVALDKLIGLKEKEGWQEGALMITSRASFEMVQKAAAVNIEVLLAVSAATTMAVDLAQKYNMSLAGFCRPGRATVYCGQQRFT